MFDSVIQLDRAGTWERMMAGKLVRQFAVSVEEKLKALAGVMPMMMEHLASLSGGDELSADDVIDQFAIAIALLIDNDSNLKTPRDIRTAAETVAKLVEERAKEFRDAQATAGYSLLTAMLGQAPRDKTADN